MYVASCRVSVAVVVLVKCLLSNFETLIRKSIFAFKTRLSNSDNAIISTLQSSWVITDTICKVWKDNNNNNNNNNVYLKSSIQTCSIDYI